MHTVSPFCMYISTMPLSGRNPTGTECEEAIRRAVSSCTDLERKHKNEVIISLRSKAQDVFSYILDHQNNFYPLLILN